MARSLVASDAIAGTANTALDSGNWGQVGQFASSGANVAYAASNYFYGHSDSSECAARWIGTGTFSNDQYSSVLIPTGVGTETWADYIGAIVRASADQDGSRDYYCARVFDRMDTGVPRVSLIKVVNGTSTTIDSTPANEAFANGDRIECEAEGTTIRGLRNGTAYHSVTDASLSTGKPGVYAIGRDSFRGNDWEGGDITGAATANPKGVFGLALHGPLKRAVYA